MKSKLTEIVANTRREVALRKQKAPESTLYLQLSNEIRSDSFYQAITSVSASSVALIAEIKHASPSNGAFGQSLNSQERLYQYQLAGADAISYVSDSTYFGGSLAELAALKAKATIPVLQKDFIIDMYQLLEASIVKVDAVLLIARILTVPELRSFVNFAQLNGVEPVVEVYNEDDLEKALQTDTRVIGVNARNLDTFEIDRARACELIMKVPAPRVPIAFSAVETHDHVQAYKKAGARAVLVGSTLMNAPDITKKIRELKGI